MEFIEQVNKEEFEQFVSTNLIKGHFMQSYYWGEVSKNKKFKPHYLGLKEDGELIATALLLEKHLISKYSFFYCPRGFVCDYNDDEVVKTFTEHIKKYCKKNKGIFLRLDPDIKLQNLDPEGNVIEGIDNHKLVEEMISLGYKHKGFNKNFENNQPRYTFRLDISKGIEEVRKNLHPTTRKIINRGNVYNIELYRGDASDIDAFYDTMIDTAQREDLVLSSKDYYNTFYTTLNKQNMSDIYIAKINIEELKKNYLSKIELIEQNIELANVKDDKKNKDKVNTKLKELNQQLDKCKAEYEEVKNIEEKELILSSIITVKYQNKVWTIHGGNRDQLRFLNANYWLYYKIIEDAVTEGFKIVDFFGTTGEPTPGNAVYGIHLFKKRLGGEYTEFIGEFDYVLKPLLYFGYTKVYPKIRKKLKR
jgi:peptidoglycan pentaglycine glycine transferase (the first glycine)